MSKKNSKLSAVLIGPMMVIGGVMALWQNEGRFDYYLAARNATVISSPNEAAGAPIAYTDSLDTKVPIDGHYVVEFNGFHVVSRYAEIYSWDESKSSDGPTTWSRGWYSYLENNSRNTDLIKTLTSGALYPDGYALGPMDISANDIHFVDDYVSISPTELRLSVQGNSLELLKSEAYFHLRKGRSDNLGDERISYRGIPNAPTASYFGLVFGGVAVGKHFEMNTGFISQMIGNDGILHHLVNGAREAALAKIKQDISQKTWMVRLFGTLVIVVGIYVFFSVFMSLLYRIPVIGTFVSYGVFLVSIGLGLSLALSVMLAGLIFHHPLTIALPLAAIIGAVVWFIRRTRATAANAKRLLAIQLTARKNAASQVVPPPPPPEGAAAPPPPPAAVLTESELIERTFVNLALVAMSEGKLHRKENKYLTSWGKDNGVSAERMTELFDQAKNDPPEAHPATAEDLDLMACMAMADGVLSNNEWYFLLKIAEGVGLKPQELRKMLQDIEDGVALPA